MRNKTLGEVSYRDTEQQDCLEDVGGLIPEQGDCLLEVRRVEKKLKREKKLTTRQMTTKMAAATSLVRKLGRMALKLSRKKA